MNKFNKIYLILLITTIFCNLFLSIFYLATEKPDLAAGWIVATTWSSIYTYTNSKSNTINNE